MIQLTRYWIPKVFATVASTSISPRFRNGERFLKVGDGRVPLLALRVIEPGPESCRFILSDCPFFMLYVISVGRLANEDYEFSI